MKKILLALCVVATMASCASDGCKIEGKLKNISPDIMVYVMDMWGTREIIDSAKVVNNGFEFKTLHHEPTFAHLVTKNGRPLTHLFIEKGAKIVVSGDADKSEVVAHGTAANDGLMQMMQSAKTIMQRFDEAQAAGDAVAVAAIRDEYYAMQQTSFEENATNIFGLFMLQQLSYSKSAAEVLKMHEQLSEEVKALPIAVQIKSDAERKMKTEPQAEGSDYVPHYIDVTYPNLAGEEVSLKSIVENRSNRYVLLDFWASWCGPCMREMPYLREAYKTYHKRGFEIYGVSFDKSKDAWEKAVKEQNMKWVNVSPLGGFENVAAEEYCVTSIPTNFLIDCSNGVIIAKNLRGEAVVEKLAELLK